MSRPSRATETQTRQRAAIRRVLEAERRPMTAQEIHRLARQAIPRLGVSTVYRLIRRMLDEHQLVGVDFPGQPPRYELPTLDLHSHFICSGCQKVFDLPDPVEPPAVVLPEGFKSHGWETVVFGTCADCSRQRLEIGDEE